jgi:hypothetical protein
LFKVWQLHAAFASAPNPAFGGQLIHMCLAHAFKPSCWACSKVMEKLIDDFGSKKRRRVVRLDLSLRAFANPSGTGVTSSVTSGVTSSAGSVTSSAAAAGAAAGQGGLERAGLLPVPGVTEYCAGLRESIRACFEVRQEAYVNEVSGGVCVSFVFRYQHLTSAAPVHLGPSAIS